MNCCPSRRPRPLSELVAFAVRRRIIPMNRLVAYAIAFLLSAVSPHAYSTSSGRPGTSALLADAAEKMDRAAIRALLKKPVDVNTPQADGMTALHWAAFQDDEEIVELLVGAGANVNAANRYGVTPLSLACTNGNGVMVARLLKAGADPNAVLPGGETPLMTAARTGALTAV